MLPGASLVSEESALAAPQVDSTVCLRIYFFSLLIRRTGRELLSVNFVDIKSSARLMTDVTAFAERRSHR